MNWNEGQIKILKRLNLSFDPLTQMSDDQIVELEDATSCYLATHGFTASDSVNPTGEICESILDAISEL